MDSRCRIDPAEEARRRQAVMDGLGVYDAEWALSKVLMQSDVQAGQNQLLLTKEAVRASHIPELFPELKELRGNGLNAENRVLVKVLDAEGREKVVSLRYLNSGKAYRVIGSNWRRLVDESRMCKGDRLDFYTCRRGDGERCLFLFRSHGSGAGGTSRSNSLVL
uniref:TF-B3 domain-containing protein n=1 Tax=Triticum urartu TaxID=4572 RepID=A0A8R7R6B3_TRIUA